MAIIREYQKKPLIVKAVQWFPGDEESYPYLKECGTKLPLDERKGEIFNKKHDYYLDVAPYDWIINPGGEDMYPCKPDEFAKTYTPVKGV